METTTASPPPASVPVTASVTTPATTTSTAGSDKKSSSIGGILVALFFTAVAVGGTIILFKKFGTPKVINEEDDVQAQTQAKEEAKSSGQPYTPPPATDGFPMNVGMRGANVGKLQSALINHFFAKLTTDNKPTNYFGTATLAAIKDIGYSVPLSEDDYNRILAGKYTAYKSPTTGTTMS